MMKMGSLSSTSVGHAQTFVRGLLLTRLLTSALSSAMALNKMEVASRLILTRVLRSSTRMMKEVSVPVLMHITLSAGAMMSFRTTLCSLRLSLHAFANRHHNRPRKSL